MVLCIVVWGGVVWGDVVYLLVVLNVGIGIDREKILDGVEMTIFCRESERSDQVSVAMVIDIGTMRE